MSSLHQSTNYFYDASGRVFYNGGQQYGSQYINPQDLSMPMTHSTSRASNGSAASGSSFYSSYPQSPSSFSPSPTSAQQGEYFQQEYHRQPQSPPIVASTPSRRPSDKSKKFPCLFADCPSNAAFTRPADLTRHQQTVHKIAPMVDCPEGWCGRVGEDGFNRPDHLNEHLRSYHMRDIPKQGRGRRVKK